MTAQFGRMSPDKKRQELTPVPSKLGKMGKQTEDNLAARMKRSLESNKSDSGDDDDDKNEEETPPLKKQKPAHEGLFFNDILVKNLRIQ